MEVIKTISVEEIVQDQGTQENISIHNTSIENIAFFSNTGHQNKDYMTNDNLRLVQTISRNASYISKIYSLINH